MEEFLNVLKDMKFMINTAIVLVEHPGNGESKKASVVKMVDDFISQNNIDIPIPLSIFNWIIGEAVDVSVRWMNENIWKKGKEQPS